MSIDTSNKFFVGVMGDNIQMMKPVPQSITKADALNLAAWIVALADDSCGEPDGTFDKLFKAICNT